MSHFEIFFSLNDKNELQGYIKLDLFSSAVALCHNFNSRTYFISVTTCICLPYILFYLTGFVHWHHSCLSLGTCSSFELALGMDFQHHLLIAMQSSC